MEDLMENKTSPEELKINVKVEDGDPRRGSEESVAGNNSKSKTGKTLAGAAPKKPNRKIELDKHYENAIEVLAHSNATPIKGYVDGGYACCFCSQRYGKASDLKTHTLERHSEVNIKEFLIKPGYDEYYVKLDITDLQCSICCHQIDTIETLLDHLREKHERNINFDVKNRLIPFKFSTALLTCCVCHMVCSRFKMLIEHMSCHYKNYVCGVCDAGFITKNMERSHSRIHKRGSFKCDYCPLIFDTSVKKGNHQNYVHTHVARRNKCAYCTETFKYFTCKQRHLKEVHGIDTKRKCLACDLSFETQKKLRAHIKKKHFEDKDTLLTTHVKNFECMICKKKFSLKKTLRVHMRIHVREQKEAEDALV